MLAQNLVDERDVLIGVRRASLEQNRGRRHTLIDGERAHHFGFLEAVDVARRQDQHGRVAALVQIDGLCDPLLRAAAGLSGLADAAGKDDDRIGGAPAAR